jgi:hypothetical protein
MVSVDISSVRVLFGPQKGFGGIQDIVPIAFQAKKRMFSPAACQAGSIDAKS